MNIGFIDQCGRTFIDPKELKHLNNAASGKEEGSSVTSFKLTVQIQCDPHFVKDIADALRKQIREDGEDPSSYVKYLTTSPEDRSRTLLHYRLIFAEPSSESIILYLEVYGWEKDNLYLDELIEKGVFAELYLDITMTSHYLIRRGRDERTDRNGKLTVTLRWAKAVRVISRIKLGLQEETT